MFTVAASRTLPNRGDTPIRSAEGFLGSDVPFDVTAELALPEFGPSRRKAREPAPFVSVPKAAVDENYCAAHWEDEIRTT